MQPRLQQLLTERHVRFETIPHLRAFTAQETAESAHISGQELAKTVMAKLDGKLVMVVVPATRRIDFERLRRMAGAHSAELAHEDEFRDLFPDCEIGAMPPFGNLWGLPVYVDHMNVAKIHLTEGTVKLMRALLAKDPSLRPRNWREVAELCQVRLQSVQSGAAFQGSEAPRDARHLADSSTFQRLGQFMERNLGSSISDYQGRRVLHTTGRERILIWILAAVFLGGAVAAYLSSR